MTRIKAFLQQLNWKILLIRILVNAASLALTVLIIPDVYFINRRLGTVLVISIGLGILNALVKPVILLLTGQFIFATFGLLLILVNALILYLLEWLFPNYLAVDSLLWAIIGGAILSLLSNALENLLGLTPPIVPDDNVELRKRIEAGQQPSLASLVVKPQTVLHSDTETQAVSEVSAARAALEAIHSVVPADAASSPAEESTPESMPSAPESGQSGGAPPPDITETADDEKAEDAPQGGAA